MKKILPKITKNGWIGVDLDGTLAHYDEWVDISHVGEPIVPMLDRVRSWIAEGREVRIFTARVSPKSAEANGVSLDDVKAPILAWLFNHVGFHLEITHEKDLSMIQLWDDRCVQVIPNTGRRADGKV